MKRVILLILLSSVVLDTVSAQDILFPYRENFAWQVKQIDEFMDRFNNADYTPIRRYLKEEYNLEDVSRSDIIRSMFNLDNSEWKQEEVVQFLSQVNDSLPPPYLDFYDDDWYAELDCKGVYQGDTVYFTMVLSLENSEKPKGSRWVINGVQGDFLPTDTVALAFAMDADYDVSKTLNPASFGTDFMALVDALKDTANLEGYIAPQNINRPLVSLLNQLYLRNLIFKQVNHITYHFLQIKDWIFQVQDFRRQSTNSGWLINSLMSVTEEEKDLYREQVLYLP